LFFAEILGHGVHSFSSSALVAQFEHSMRPNWAVDWAYKCALG
jgi:hypothetical protein